MSSGARTTRATQGTSTIAITTARKTQASRQPTVSMTSARIGTMNMTARGNVALGIRSQEFSASCGLPPLATPSPDGVPSA